MPPSKQERKCAEYWNTVSWQRPTSPKTHSSGTRWINQWSYHFQTGSKCFLHKLAQLKHSEDQNIIVHLRTPSGLINQEHQEYSTTESFNLVHSFPTARLTLNIILNVSQSKVTRSHKRRTISAMNGWSHSLLNAYIHGNRQPWARAAHHYYSAQANLAFYFPWPSNTKWQR